MVIRQLDYEDQQAVRNLLNNRKIEGVDVENFQLNISHADDFVDFYLSPHRKPTSVAFGAYDEFEGKLAYIVTASFSFYCNVWSMGGIRGRGNKLSLTLLKGLIQHTCGFAEARGYHSFYVIVPYKRRRTYLRMTGIDKKYNIYIDCLIPPKEKPIFYWYWDMMGRKLWDMPLSVVKCIQKEALCQP